jgi:putative copper export protein
VSPDALSITLRALALILLFQAVGAAFFIALFAPHLRASWHPIRLLGIATAGCAMLLALLHHGLEAARMADDFGGLWDASLQSLAWGSRSVVSTALLAAGLLLLMGSLRRRSAKPADGQAMPTGLQWASVGGSLALSALLMSGHTSAHPAHTLLAPLLALHLLIVAFWYGALWPLILVTRVEAALVAAQIFARWSRMAGYLVPLIAVAGVILGRILTGEWPGAWVAAQQPYGQLLLLKLLLFALLMVPAAANKWWLVPALRAAAATTPAIARGALSALRRSIVLEMLLIAIVLTVTATLTTLYSPQPHETTRATASTMTAPA